ncbi:hypothetical protein SDC9_203475 [bioreactor metagenome]|uniref:Uncharacterized protein n=1 Tax=bioreactor metagenome TaxID=1076179 RepID=A0A645IWU0_9ZZZZ
MGNILGKGGFDFFKNSLFFLNAKAFYFFFQCKEPFYGHAAAFFGALIQKVGFLLLNKGIFFFLNQAFKKLIPRCFLAIRVLEAFSQFHKGLM